VDSKNIKVVAEQLQGALPFGSEGITTQAQYNSALALAKTTNDSETLLHRVLSMEIRNYEAAQVQDSELLDNARKNMDRFCDTPGSSISFNRNEIISLVSFIVVITILSKIFLI
jgi:hypothetical protein